MGRLSRTISLPIGPNNSLVPGTLLMNDNGDAEWFEGVGLGQQQTPTFTSNASDDYKWVKSSNCVDGVTCPTSDELTRFRISNSSKNLNDARLQTWNSPTGYNSPLTAKDLNVPGSLNTATTPPQQGPTPDGKTLDEVIKEDNPAKVVEINDIEGVSSRTSYGPYKYPLNLDLRTQDAIQFTMIKPVASKFNPEFGAKTISSKYDIKNSLGYVTLPIQPTISDSNTVDWSGLTLNAFDAYLSGQAINLAGSKNFNDLFSKGLGALQDVAGKFAVDKNLQTALNIGLAQEAVGIQGLLSRATGAVLNPNLELLFNGPQLRAFSFTFRMSPRSEPEAKQVRSIIRFFKQGMSVKTTSSSVFLKSPHVFDIKYIAAEGKDHPSINKIKTCALVGCDVDYTPDGTYMTFNDTKRTMTSYGITLRFSEIEPIYDKDYVFADDEIGF